MSDELGNLVASPLPTSIQYSLKALAFRSARTLDTNECFSNDCHIRRSAFRNIVSGLWLLGCLTTGRHCLKSPAKIMHLPPNLMSLLRVCSRRQRSIALNINLSTCEHSSIIKTSFSTKSSASSLPALILDIHASSDGIFKRNLE